MFGMNGFHVSASGAIQGHHDPLVLLTINFLTPPSFPLPPPPLKIFNQNLVLTFTNHDY